MEGTVKIDPVQVMKTKNPLYHPPLLALTTCTFHFLQFYGVFRPYLKKSLL